VLDRVSATSKENALGAEEAIAPKMRSTLRAELSFKRFACAGTINKPGHRGNQDKRQRDLPFTESATPTTATFRLTAR